jgi:hypothetical protein
MEGIDNNSIANESHLNQNYPIRSNVGISTFEIAQEDLEEGPLRMDCTATGVDDTEVIHFIEKSVLSEGYYDYYDQVLPTIFEHPNMSKAAEPCPQSSSNVNFSIVETNILWVENSATGMFLPVRKRASVTETILDQNATSNVEDDDKRLENVSFLPKINLTDDKHKPEEEETLLIPPHPPMNKAAQEQQSVSTRGDEWTVVTMEYQNFNFMKRLFFLFFQVNVICQRKIILIIFPLGYSGGVLFCHVLFSNFFGNGSKFPSVTILMFNRMVIILHYLIFINRWLKRFDVSTISSRPFP